jgi:pyridoxamine 5'-phosphate oxidase
MESLSRHTDYGDLGLEREDLDPSPFTQLANWIRDAEAADVFEPNAMVISTVDAAGAVSSRTVLLKGLDESGLEFVTNYGSRKGRALAEHPAISAVFPWYSLKRQIIVTGTAQRATAEASDAYHARRPRGAQLSAWASDQSQPVENKAVLEKRLADFEKKFEHDDEVPRPEKWGAFRIAPTAFEFWQGRSMRFHDRFRYELQPDGSWSITMLQP